jgi:hypothetical protein
MITVPLNSSHLSFAHTLWKKHLYSYDWAIDATCGNGRDTLVLAHLLPEGGVIGLDIQLRAIVETQTYVGQRANVILHHRCHSEIGAIFCPKKPRLIVYNLGYLPKGDKKMTTMTETTLQSLQGAIEILAEDGALSITCYPGHPEGAREEGAVRAWADHFGESACYYYPLQRKRAPTLFWIARNEKYWQDRSFIPDNERDSFRT